MKKELWLSQNEKGYVLGLENTELAQLSNMKKLVKKLKLNLSKPKKICNLETYESMQDNAKSLGLKGYLTNNDWAKIKNTLECN